MRTEKRMPLLRTLLRKLYLVFALAILLGGMSAGTGSAADEKPVACIGEKGFSTLKEAVRTARSGDVIVVQRAVTLDRSLVFDQKKVLVLDFSGKTLTYTGTGSAILVKAGSLSIRGGRLLLQEKEKGALCIDVKKGAGASLYTGTFEGTIRNRGLIEISGGTRDPGGFLSSVNNLGICLIEGGTFRGDLTNEGKLTVSGGKFAARNIIALHNTGTCVIRDGVFTRQIDQADGKMTISGGSFTYKDEEVQIDVSKGTLLLTGGHFRAYGEAPNLHVGKKAKVRITGGIFRADRLSRAGNVLDEGRLTITGGSFDRDIDIASAYPPEIMSSVKVRITYG